MCVLRHLLQGDSNVTENAHPEAGLLREPVEIRTTQDLGAAVRAFRKDRGLTQADLAEWLGTNRFTIHRLEMGGPVGLPLALAAVTFLGRSVVLQPRNPGDG